MITIDFDNETINLNDISKINVYKNGNISSYITSSSEFKAIINNLSSILESARIMPAFGVSLDEMVKQEISSDNWLELEFSCNQTINGLPFDKLLFKLEECYGFNLIRNYQNSYTGRCIYLDLDNLNDLNRIINFVE